MKNMQSIFFLPACCSIIVPWGAYIPMKNGQISNPGLFVHMITFYKMDILSSENIFLNSCMLVNQKAILSVIDECVHIYLYTSIKFSTVLLI